MTVRLRSAKVPAVLAWSVLLSALLAGTPLTARAEETPKPLIVFMTDFGTVDDAVAICKGVIKAIAPDAEIIDLTHQVTPYSIEEGARFLARTSQYYPPNTVFLAVIDPGVGTSRRSIVVKTGRGQYFVLPDNGLITPVADRDGVAGVRELTNPKWRLAGSSSATFHGRDVYSPAAAHLQRGEDWTEAGPPLAAVTRLETPRVVVDASGAKGRVVGLDGPYGNLVTNISAEDLAGLGYHVGDAVRLDLAGTALAVPFVKTFGAVPVGRPLLYIDSRGMVSLAINQGNFAAVHAIAPPVSLRIARK